MKGLLELEARCGAVLVKEAAAHLAAVRKPYTRRLLFFITLKPRVE